MLYNRMSRRHFLQGAGGATLALPFLPSLMSKAEAATLPSPKFMVAFWSGHGGIHIQNMSPVATNPAIASQLQTSTLYAAQSHNILSGKLVNLKSTRAANLPYLGTVLDGTIRPQGDGAPLTNSYAIDPQGNDFDAGAARVTPIVGSFVSDALLNKMNLVAGLDYMYYSGHTWGALGNFCNYAGNNPTSPTANSFTNVWVPSIDAVCAKYPGFYGTANPVAPSVMLNTYYLSAEDYGALLSKYPSSSGVVDNSFTPNNVGQLFSLLFGNLVANQNPVVAAKKGFILNKVHDDYTRVAKGAYGPGRRIGQADRSRLEEFMANLMSIIGGMTPSGACAIPSISPTDTSSVFSASGDATSAATFHLYNQLITAAFNCGLTQSFIVGMPSLFDVFVPSGSPGQTFTDGVTGPDSHQALFHEHNWADRQPFMVKGHRYYFQYGFYDLMQQLDAVSAPQGGTLLDQAMMFWTHECGFNTHMGNGLPMIMAGGAGGFFKTGNYVDLRNANAPIGQWSSIQGHVGVPYNRFLATALQAMGVPPTTYELSQSLFSGCTGRIPITSRGTVPGYGHPYQQSMYIGNTNTQAFLYDYQLNDMSVTLPIIT